MTNHQRAAVILLPFNARAEASHHCLGNMQPYKQGSSQWPCQVSGITDLNVMKSRERKKKKRLEMSMQATHSFFTESGSSCFPLTRARSLGEGCALLLQKAVRTVWAIDDLLGWRKESGTHGGNDLKKRIRIRCSIPECIRQLSHRDCVGIWSRKLFLLWQFKSYLLV